MKATNFFSTACVACGYLVNYLTSQAFNYRVLCDSCGEKRAARLYASDVDARRRRGDLFDAERRGKRAGRATLATLRTHAELKELANAARAAERAARRTRDAACSAIYDGSEAKRAARQGESNFLFCVWRELDAQAEVYAHALEAARAARRLGFKPRDFRAVKFGVKDFGDGFGVAFYVFPAFRLKPCATCETRGATCAEPCRERISEVDAERAANFEEYDGGTGREFSKRATVYRAGSRIIVSQSYGVDV
jgi:hypothetical protein